MYTQTCKLSPPIANIATPCLVTLCATVFAELLLPRCTEHNNFPKFLTSMVLVHLLTILQATSLLHFIDYNPLLSITTDSYAVSVE
jgi:hypothetical protein